MNNLHPEPLKSTTSNSSKTIMGRPISQLVNRLDAVILVQKTCKEGQCREPWAQLHPDGVVKNLRDALDTKWDEKYASYPKVVFEQCFHEPVYRRWAEKPHWQELQGNQSAMMMGDGLDWDTWA
jgi:N-acetylglucosamine-6-sulfatase